MSPHPSPRLLPLTFRVSLQHDAILLVVLRVDVGFIPTLKAFVTFHQRMRLRSLCRSDTERPGSMPLKLPAHQRHDIVVVAEAVTRAVQRHKPLTAGDVVQQCLGLFVLDLVDVSKQHQSIELRQPLGIEIANDVGVLQLNPTNFQHRLQLPKPRPRLMMPVVTEIQQLELLGRMPIGATQGQTNHSKGCSKP